MSTWMNKMYFISFQSQLIFFGTDFAPSCGQSCSSEPEGQSKYRSQTSFSGSKHLDDDVQVHRDPEQPNTEQQFLSKNLKYIITIGSFLGN